MSTPESAPAPVSDAASTPAAPAAADVPATEVAPAAEPSAVEPAPAVATEEPAPAVDLDDPAETTEPPAATETVSNDSPPVEPAPTIPTWNTVASIGESLSSGQVPAHVVPYIRAALATMQPLEGRVKAAEAEYSQAKEKFLSAAAQMEAGGQKGSVALADSHAKVIDNLENITSELVDTALELFNARHPDYATLPENHPTRIYLAKMWADGTAEKVFQGNYVQKMDQAWEFACFQTKYTPQAKKPVAKAANPDAARQVLVNDGTQATGRATRDLDEMSIQEIMSQHDRLLPGI